MSKKIKLNLIKTRESYTTSKLAKTLDVHIRTIQAWKRQGLNPIENKTPFYFMGFEVKKFLEQRQKSNKTKLNKNQFYCVKCRKAVCSKNNQVEVIQTEKTIGKDNLKEFVIRGVCENCTCKLNRFSHEGRLNELKTVFKIVNIGDFKNE